MSQVSVSCCGLSWVGVDRAHCCRRTGGCGHVFDDATLWDRHRRYGRCLDPHTLDLVVTADGVWLRTLELIGLTTRRRPGRRISAARGGPGGPRTARP